MNVYNIIMAAADQIEKDPGSFKYSKPVVPECGTPGCAVGWIGTFANVAAGTCVTDVCRDVMGIPGPEDRSHLRYHVPYNIFEQRMQDIHAGWRLPEHVSGAMRRYAEIHHAHEKVEPPIILETP